MKFIKRYKDLKPINDNVFSVVRRCKEDQDPHKVNATIGMLYDEDGKLVTLNTVYNEFDNVKRAEKASYAESITGDKEFIKLIEQRYLKNVTINYSTIITPGGTGAVSSCLLNFSESGDNVIIPSVTWDPYYIIISESKLNPLNYEFLENDKFNFKGLKICIDSINDKQKNIIIIINDPCHNPTGYSMSYEEWNQLIDYANSLKNNNVIILNDIAYIDYSYTKEPTKYFELFNKIESHVVISVAASFSKSMTAYGMRVGALMNIYKDDSVRDEIEEIFKRTARGIWSNANNGAMKCFAKVLANPKMYLKEKQEYIDLMRKRSSLFLECAKKYHLPIYNYKDGFFVTIKINDENIIDKFHEKLIENHIYTIKIKGGIRITICSLAMNQIEYTVKKASEILKSIQGE